MQALRGLAWLLALQSIGELLTRGLSLPFPGPVIGMMLLLPALRWRMVREPVSACADFLLTHLSLLFVPVGVGVMTHLSLVSQYGVRMLAVIVLSTLAGLAVTVLSLHLLQGRLDPLGKEDPHA
ncbi:CidA/LrgA family protein [Polaromonas sp. JS666]|uniref:CidA/LrgA family protein n=1 Tax=Polaromonas sp. (strain JS666 / ATCC BAA-500) TaxID=296591 RepID=UPI00004642CC|nr:CidA/LrgA family protein [Polaromonas sp. JS666]ABE42396.1 LrgA [Polaromonas sp. JS666]